jgi:hypothetical protein
MYFCAWCNDPIDRSSGLLHDKPAVKHGICRHCLERKLAELSLRPTSQVKHLPVPPEAAREHLAAA